MARRRVEVHTFWDRQRDGGTLFAGQTAPGNVYPLSSRITVVQRGASLAGGVGWFMRTVAGAYVLSTNPTVLFFYEVSPFCERLFRFRSPGNLR